jgi:hypothetical protein
MSTNSIKVYNTSTLSGSHFEFNVMGYDNLNFNVQTANLPAIQVNPREIITPVGSTHLAGDKVQYEILEISFIVDESLNSWRDIYNWLRALAPTNVIDASSQNQYVNYDKDLYTSATLFILTNSLHVNLKCTFHNLFPITLTGLDFSTKDTEDRKLFATVTFAYDYYDLEINTLYNQNGAVPDNIIQ